jgi:decaprenyl-phosphate phosphoribosyltransferase
MAQKTDHHPDAIPPGSNTMGLARGLILTSRPNQWVKNLLVVAAPCGAGVIDQRPELVKTLIALAAFCVAASGGYFFNDAIDVEADRLHPRKALRPVAAGVVPVPMARAVGLGLLALALTGSYVSLGGDFAVAIGCYIALTVAYSVWLKHEAIFDLAGVAALFLVRAIAGGVAVDVHISEWFIIVAGFCSLFVVTGKRHAEHVELGDGAGDHRATLSSYSLSFLRYVRSVSSSVAIAAYCLMAFERAAETSTPIFFQLSIVPFVLAVLRYVLLVEQGKGGAPEEIFLRDRTLQALGAVWALLFAAGVYG